MTARSAARLLGIGTLLVLAGVAITVAVAWGCVIAAPPILGRTVPLPGFARPLDRVEPLSPGEVLFSRAERASPWWGLTEAMVDDHIVIDRGGGSTEHRLRGNIVWTAGWPLRALAAFETRAVPSQLRWGARVEGLTSSMPGLAPRPLPLLPLWTGLLGNAAFYAAALVLGIALYRRLARGRPAWCCRACGYDRSGLPAPAACPECGSPAPAAARA